MRKGFQLINGLLRRAARPSRNHFRSFSYAITKPSLNPKPVIPLHFHFHRSFSSKPSSQTPCSTFTRDGNFEEAAQNPLPTCPGCGVHMQDANPKHPGYFIQPSEKQPNYKSLASKGPPLAFEMEIPDSLKRGFFTEHENSDGELPEKQREAPPVVCARCHSLRHYGKVKDASVENLLPDFDFDHTVGRRLATSDGRRCVVLMVVDATDFEGTFPRRVAALVSETIEENERAWKEGKSGNVPRVVLVVTKIDLLPSSLSPTYFDHWVRTRAREGGASKVTSAHFVSSVKDWGLKDLVDDVVKLAGPRGNVWAVGAQNAGKSTLINAIGKCVGGAVSHLTEAPVPGTTLGIVRVEGVLPSKSKLFDTPGLLNPHQITTRLLREEQRLVQISKELKPRTYRIKAGHSVHIAGLMRLDIEESSVDSIYVTVWASPYLPLHMGKTENACKMKEEHFGHQLQPPIGEKRVEELGKWVRREYCVRGKSWASNSADVAAAGLGWFAIGLKGEATLGVWTYEGIDVFLRNPLVLSKSKTFELAGFTVSKIVSKADQASNKSSRKSDKKSKVKNSEAAEPKAADSRTSSSLAAEAC